MPVILKDCRGLPVPAPRQANRNGIALANQSPGRVSTIPLNRWENSQLTEQAWRNVVYKVTAY